MPKIHVCPKDLLSVNLQGKVYIVTGGNSGIGLITVQQLVKQGAQVILACRRLDQGAQAKAQIDSEGYPGSVEVMALDLASLNSVRGFATTFLSKKLPLHGLINNAGVMNTPSKKTADGFELQFGTNHLGHFLLTELLLPTLKASAPSRVVNVSSCFHDLAMKREGRIDFDDLNFERRKYDGWEAYAQSKLANLLHARELAARLKGSDVSAVSVHPGWVRTNLIQFSMPLFMQNYILRPVLRMAGMIEPWEGAQSTLFALLSPTVPENSGAYFSQVGIYRSKKHNEGGWPMQSPNPQASDDVIGKKLYEVSASLVGI